MLCNNIIISETDLFRRNTDTGDIYLEQIKVRVGSNILLVSILLWMIQHECIEYSGIERCRVTRVTSLLGPLFVVQVITGEDEIPWSMNASE